MRLKFIIIIFCLLFLVSCGRPLHENTFIVAGTYVKVISDDERAAGIVNKEFKRLESIFDPYDQDSELFELNNTYNTAVKVSSELIDIIDLSKKIHNLTDKSFNISCGRLYDFWKDLIKKGSIKKMPKPEIIEELKSPCDINDIEIDFDNDTILIKKKGLKIDLGGIAKGYMVDKAILKLKENDIKSAIINAGGDIYCLGKNKDRAWKIGLKDPENLTNIIKKSELIDLAVATSGNYEQFFKYKKRKLSHLIDSRSGYPVEGEIISVSVFSKSCAIADSLATSFFIMGLEKAKKFVSKNDMVIKALIVTRDKKGKHIYLLD